MVVALGSVLLLREEDRRAGLFFFGFRLEEYVRVTKSRRSQFQGERNPEEEEKKPASQISHSSAKSQQSLRRRQSARHGEGRDHRERKAVRARDDLKPMVTASMEQVRRQ